MNPPEQAVRLVVLGSGTSIPSGARSSSGYWLDDGTTRVRLDCGSGSVHAMARFELPWAELDYQVFSHFHVDHFSDLPALLFALKWARSQARVKPLTLLGPRGLRERVHALDVAFGKDLLDQDFPVLIRELSPGDRFPLTERAELEVRRAPHTEESLALKLTFGATSIGYTGDTAFSEQLCEFFRDVDVLVGECSFLEGTEGSLHLDARGLG
ncbi:MAG TPA: ribonuclease Z, partial [Polyangiaceae bacterium]|nr:ribonuclease Z [Polyangiaceae bacterium]